MKIFLITVLACGVLLGGCKDDVTTSTEVKETARESAAAIEQAKKAVKDVAAQANRAGTEVVAQAEKVVSDVTVKAQQATTEVVEQATEVVGQAQTKVTDAAEKVSAEGSSMVNSLLKSASEKKEQGDDALSSAAGPVSDAADSYR